MNMKDPPRWLNPLTAAPEELVRYNIPLPPDASETPALYAIWRRIFSEPRHIVTPRDRPHVLGTEEPPRLPLPTLGHYELSSNWSGAYLIPQRGGHFTDVAASWVVPTATLPPTTANQPLGDTYKSSIFIGLDGQRRYRDSSLPQIGTAQDLTIQGHPHYFVWMQWWRRDVKTGPPNIIHNVHVKPGHRVICWISVLTPMLARFVIKNESTGIVTCFTRTVPLRSFSSVQLQISGATAEWIVERPSPEAGLFDSLPDYHAVHIDDCVAVVAGGGVGVIREPTLGAAKRIIMYEIRRNPSRAAQVSVPSLVGERALRLAYQR